MERTFTREEFYDLVWSKPMTRLARELMLSTVALNMLCKKHDIPQPSLGWWAEKAAGKMVVQTPLPRSKDPSIDQVRIMGGEGGAEPRLTAVARENARILISSRDLPHQPPEDPIVERTIALLCSTVIPKGEGVATIEQPGLIKVRAAWTSAERLRLSLNRIAAAAELVGAKLVATKDAAAFECEGETVDFCVIEKTKQVKHVMTKEELAGEKAWKIERERKFGKNEWDDILSPFYNIRHSSDALPTGELSFEIKRLHITEEPTQRTYRDGEKKNLEDLAVDIAVAIRVLAEAIKQDRLIREERARKEAEAWRRHELVLRTKHVEDRRRSTLDDLLQELGTLDRLRRLVGALRAERGSASTGRLGAFIAFAEARLAAQERALSADALEQRFAEKRLFGDDDDFDFQLRRY